MNKEETRDDGTEQSSTVLTAIVGTYFSVHVIDLQNDTFTEFKTNETINCFLDANDNAAERMYQIMYNTVCENDKERILAFSDLHTLAQRMHDSDTLSEEFICSNVGWVKEQFIVIHRDADGYPTKVVHTIEEIGEQKRREQLLKTMSYQDGLTGCLNRLAYRDRIAELKQPLDPKLVFIGFDLNCVKVINDAFGHAAGDELIKGAYECLYKCLNFYGHVYRTGGDEYVAIIMADEDELKDIERSLQNTFESWKGELVDEMYISYGYACAKDYPGLSILELAKVADEKMYQAKNAFYVNKGIDRRGQKLAYSALCSSYIKVTKLNLTYNTHQVISMNDNERNAEFGYSSNHTEWVANFSRAAVHKEDAEHFKAVMNTKALQAYFKAGNKILKLSYRRVIDGVYKRVLLEAIPAEDYSLINQCIYVLVKDIEL